MSHAVLKKCLHALHVIEDDLEHANALNPDPRLSDAEIALHRCITDVHRAKEGQPAPTPISCYPDGYPLRSQR